jgi:lysozyme family protein
MYPPDFIAALSDTLRYEGGYVNHPKDPGGATNLGITQAVYSEYCRRHGRAAQSVKNIAREEVESIYYTNYWLASCCHWMPGKLAQAVFDFAVNSGVKRALQYLQRIIGATDDGAFGERSLAAMNAYIRTKGEDNLVFEYLRQREAFFNEIARKRPSMRVFLKGWLNRVWSLRKKLLRK